MASPPSRFPPRILEWLRGHPCATAQEIADGVHISRWHAHALLRELHRAGEIHISAWGSFDTRNQRYWSVGRAADAVRPPVQTHKQAYSRRKERLMREVGSEVAGRILMCRRKGGPAVIFRDGEVVYRRGAPRGCR